MKNVYSLAVVASLGLTACGSGHPLSADEAATALQALIETTQTYQGRSSEATSVTCAQGGQVQGSTLRNETDRAERGQNVVFQLKACKSHDIIMEGLVTGEPRRADASQTFRGSISLHGSVQATCDVYLVTTSQETQAPNPSKFCGHRVAELIALLNKRGQATPLPVPANPPAAKAGDDVVTDTADVTDLADTTDSADITDTADVMEVPDEITPDDIVADETGADEIIPDAPSAAPKPAQ